MASINVEMAVSGAQKCQQQIREVSTQVKAMQSALKLADSEFKLTGDATAMYTSKIQTLQAQIAAQNFLLVSFLFQSIMFAPPDNS